MTERYHFAYGEATVYASVVDLVRRYRLDAGTVVADIGCGFGAIAEPVRDLGLTYVGFDVDPEGLQDLEQRGFEGDLVDLGAPAEAVATIEKRLSGRQLSAICMIDSLEHITNGPDVLRHLRVLATSHQGAPLVLAVPNVTHLDLAAKLLLGRWDMTPTGLLDDTHVSFFSPGRLGSMTRQAGWAELGSADFELPESDQHFPAGAPVLQRRTPLHELLFNVRTQADEGAIVNEFVRAYAPVALPADAGTDEGGEGAPFLSVLMRTQCTRPETLQEALLSLAAQTSQDFEVLLLAHDVGREELFDLQHHADVFGEEFAGRVRLIPVDGGGRSRPLNVGVEAARGRYVAILDDDDVVFGNWLETFEHLAAKHPGHVLRCSAVEQDVELTTWPGQRDGYAIAGRPRCRWPEPFDVVDHLFENHSPPCGYALPRSMFAEQGLRFDETLPVLEDWDVLMQAVSWCGVADGKAVTALWRRWRIGDSSTSVHTEHEWLRARSAVIGKLDSRPLLLPARTVTSLQDLHNRVFALQAECDQLRGAVEGERRHNAELRSAADRAREQLVEIRTSTSWKVAKPVRVLGEFARRVLRPGS